LAPERGCWQGANPSPADKLDQATLGATGVPVPGLPFLPANAITDGRIRPRGPIGRCSEGGKAIGGLTATTAGYPGGRQV